MFKNKFSVLINKKKIKNYNNERARTISAIVIATYRLNWLRGHFCKIGFKLFVLLNFVLTSKHPTHDCSFSWNGFINYLFLGTVSHYKI